MKKIKSKSFLIIFLLYASIYSQDNSSYNNNPFSIYKFNDQIIIAGSVNTFVYSDYRGTDVSKESYTDPHLKPEYLIFELFKSMKNKDLQQIENLYDTTLTDQDFNINEIAEKLRNYTDIKFLSKFQSGDLIIVRYDFISLHDEYSYFAMIRRVNEKYYLSTDVNVSDPFNIIGSFSPNNLFERPDEAVNTSNMTPFYFVEIDHKVFFTNQIPTEDFITLYLNLEYYQEGSGAPEIEFIKTIQQDANSTDTTQMMNLVDPNDLSLLSQDYYKYYLYIEIIKMFKNFQITPLASLSFNGGKVIYLKCRRNDFPSGVYSIALKEVDGKYFISLKIDDDTLNNVLLNGYIKEAIYNYFKNK